MTLNCSENILCASFCLNLQWSGTILAFFSSIMMTALISSWCNINNLQQKPTFNVTEIRLLIIKKTRNLRQVFLHQKMYSKQWHCMGHSDLRVTQHELQIKNKTATVLCVLLSMQEWTAWEDDSNWCSCKSVQGKQSVNELLKIWISKVILK